METAREKLETLSENQHFPKTKNRVLLVEDDVLSENAAKNILSTLHCDVDIATNGKEALQLVEKEHYDLIFMDIGLPQMSGYEIAKRIRSHALTSISHIPIIALTAHTDRDNQQHCLDAKINAVISKPLTLEQAKNILGIFILRQKKKTEKFEHTMNTDENPTEIEKIVDFEYAKSLLGGNETVAREMLTTLINSLPNEVEKLTDAYQQKNWEAIGAIAHKLKGAASYCGTLRLKKICVELENYIKSGLTARIPELYQKMLVEIEVLEKFAMPPLKKGADAEGGGGI